MWDVVLAPLAAEGPITADAYVRAQERVGFKRKSKIMFEFLYLLFDIVDKNDDGHISLPEFRVFWQVIGADENHVESAFNAIDTDGDGQTSKAEFLYAGERFIASYQHSNFMGPLADKPADVL
jgi:hypothetical protein